MNDRRDDIKRGQKQRLELFLPDPKKRKECKSSLNQYTVYQLMPKFRHMKTLLEGKECVLMAEDGERYFPKELQAILCKKGNLTKSELLDFLVFFMSDSRNFGVYFRLLPIEQQRVWTLLVKNYFASDDLLKKVTGVHWLKKSKERYWGRVEVELSPEVPWLEVFKVERSYPEVDELYLYIPRFLRPYLYPFFFPDAQGDFETVAVLPENEGLLTFNGEKKIFGLLPVLDTFYKQGFLEMGKSGKWGVSVLGKLGKLLHVDEFFSGVDNKTVNSLRLSTLLTPYVIYRSLSKVDKSPELFVKNMIGNFMADSSYLLSTVLSHVNGIRMTMMSDTYVCEQVASIMDVLASQDSRHWVSVDSLCSRLYFSEPGACYNLLFTSYVFYKASFTNNKHDKELISLDDVYSEISVPFIKGYLFLLASLGLLEIAYGDYDLDSCSHYDSLRYFRLTGLGRFVLGLRKEYVPELTEDGEDVFEVDEDKLIVRSVREENPYELLLTDFAEPISPHRYGVSYASFLKNSTNASDIEKKIDFFHQYVCKQPSRVWEDFFSDLRRRCQPFQEVSPRKYVMYRLDAKDQDLLRLVSSDEYLRKYTLRAESYLLLVDAAYLREVRNRLKEFGYLI